MDKKIEPYILCPAEWHTSKGIFCALTLKECEKSIQKCPEFQKYILGDFTKIEKL